MKSSDERGVSSGRKKAQFHSVSGRMCLLLVYFEEVCKVSLSSKKVSVLAMPLLGVQSSTRAAHLPVKLFSIFLLHVSLRSEITMKEGVIKVKK